MICQKCKCEMLDCGHLTGKGVPFLEAIRKGRTVFLPKVKDRPEAAVCPKCGCVIFYPRRKEEDPGAENGGRRGNPDLAEGRESV